MMQYAILAYVYLINLAAFLLMCLDKVNAQREARRVPEKVLFLVSIFGGSVGAIAAMFAFRHKTKHLSFVLGLPAILLVQLVVIVLLTR